MSVLQEVEFNFRARYFKLGTITEQTRQIVFALHGYGQLAQYFIRKFESVQNEHTCIIAPEGLSRFYLQDIATRTQTGDTKVGATWMTKENRLMDIDNYIVYLNTLYAKEVPTNYTGQVTLLGFSQGAATASRWACSSVPFHKLILWAGVFPPDIDFEKGASALKDKNIIEVYGTQDPFLNESRLTEMLQLNQQLGISPTIIPFNGTHELNTEVLKQILM